MARVGDWESGEWGVGETAWHGSRVRDSLSVRERMVCMMAKVRIKFSETTPAQRRKMIRDLAKRLDVNESIGDLVEEMQQFERKYKMSTIDFYARFASGKLEDADSGDFMRWAIAFADYQHLLGKQFSAREVSLASP